LLATDLPMAEILATGTTTIDFSQLKFGTTTKTGSKKSKEAVIATAKIQ